MLDHQYWGRGYATEIVSSLLNWVSHHFSCQNIYAFTGTDHLASIRVMQKTGMKYVETLKLKGVECVLYKYKIKKRGG